MSIAHLQVGKTVYDVLNRHTEANTLPTRNELMAELSPIMLILGRKISTAQACLNSLVRTNVVVKEGKVYLVAKKWNSRSFALDIDRNNTHKMLITHIDVPLPDSPIDGTSDDEASDE